MSGAVASLHWLFSLLAHTVPWMNCARGDGGVAGFWAIGTYPRTVPGSENGIKYTQRDNACCLSSLDVHSCSRVIAIVSPFSLYDVVVAVVVVARAHATHKCVVMRAFIEKFMRPPAHRQKNVDTKYSFCICSIRIRAKQRMDKGGGRRKRRRRGRKRKKKQRKIFFFKQNGNKTYFPSNGDGLLRHLS